VDGAWNISETSEVYDYICKLKWAKRLSNFHGKQLQIYERSLLCEACGSSRKCRMAVDG